MVQLHHKGHNHFFKSFTVLCLGLGIHWKLLENIFLCLPEFLKLRFLNYFIWVLTLIVDSYGGKINKKTRIGFWPSVVFYLTLLSDSNLGLKEHNWQVTIFTQWPKFYEKKQEVCTIPFIEINWGILQDFTRRGYGGWAALSLRVKHALFRLVVR